MNASHKDSVFITYEDDIKKMYPTKEEQEKVLYILYKAKEESEKKAIKRIREVKPFSIFIKRLGVKIKYGIHWKKPFYPFRLLRNYFLTYLYKFLGMKKHVFRGIEFAITYKCNFHCTHCLCSRIDETKYRDELTPEEYKRLVKEAMKMGATTFGLEGGEPLVNKEWREIIKSFIPHYNHVIISTNGWLFSEETVKECAKLGVDTINFSLDSSIPELHDLFRRKKGSHERVLNAIKYCKKYGIKPIINTVVHKGNLYTSGLLNLLEFAEDEKVMINMLFAKGVGEFKSKESMLDRDDLNAYGKLVEPYAYCNIHHSFKEHKGTLNYNYGSGGCPGVSEMFNMTPYGDVLNCANMHIYFGNVREKSLKDIRENTYKTSPFGDYRPCFLTLDEHFMAIYYNLLEEKTHITLEEFMDVVKAYEQKNNISLYPGIPIKEKE
ncbi:radical SAM/SPASM domain-containing protein [Desulfobacula phenolica]|uniref:Radical SAM superfamily enzyme, MoaA/NifB/PqqE/SkfB family n=1 Tax=Desulfobacula phenolica TaxID=90732 RepID=A0A1H2DT26_9BACT|nr:radical SAM protein [Desulfobacula phenolica]SDT85578.1 Radical SAM superfamily enzyme, MoaA/NifB/PqqE/SkfB family [Desulfobacula phenolica]